MGELQDLGVPAGDDIAIAWDVNDSNQAVGQSEANGEGSVGGHAVLWQGGNAQPLATLNGIQPTVANGINNVGHITGHDPNNRGFLYNGATNIAITTSGGPQSFPQAISDNDFVVGYTRVDVAAPPLAFIWDSVGGLKALGTLSGDSSSIAYDLATVSGATQVVGRSTGSVSRAFIWQDGDGDGQGAGDPGEMKELLTLVTNPTGWTNLEEARSINNAGQITGFGTKNGETHAFLLSPPGASPTPTPTPITYSVSGQVKDGANAPVSGVLITFEMNFQGALSTTSTLTDASGNYASGDLGCKNNVKVTPSKAGYSFNPLAIAFVNSSGCLSGTATADFTATAAPTPTPTPTPMTVQFAQGSFSVNENDGVATITVTRSGDTSSTASVNYRTSDVAGLQACTVTNTLASERCDYTTQVGTVSFAAGENSKTFIVPITDDVWVEGNETFTVTLSSPAGAVLGSIPTATVTIVDNDLATPTSNPIDGVDFFILQMYRDILNRQPDQTGFQNWVNTLAPCPNGGFGEPPTSDCDRLHVAAGFFQSDEFLNRGYFAFRFYLVAFNQRPTYAQFIPDMALVGGPKSPAEEEASKVAFANAFVQRPEFISRYGSASGQALADALLATAGLPAGSYNAGGQTNGQILRGIAESSAALNKFLTEGTVSILYFGFQRRDPDATGYQNNLDTLNANPNNLRHMIFIFIYSTEYRNRFGPS
jgi:uncharacterized membrane protein